MNIGPEEKSMRGKRALVLGGSGGIGKAVSHRISGAGAELWLHGGHDAARLARMAEELEGAGGIVHPVLRVFERAHEVQPFLAELPPPDLVVVAFGPLISKHLEETSAQEWTVACEMNLALPGIVVSCCLPSMRASGFGRIVLFGGAGTDRIRSFSSIAAYGAAKTGLSSLVKSAARAVRGLDITVNAVCPGFVDTEYLDSERRTRYRELSPGGQLQRPEEVAEIAFGLLKPGFNAVSGAVITAGSGVI